MHGQIEAQAIQQIFSFSCFQWRLLRPSKRIRELQWYTPPSKMEVILFNFIYFPAYSRNREFQSHARILLAFWLLAGVHKQSTSIVGFLKFCVARYMKLFPFFFFFFFLGGEAMNCHHQNQLLMQSNALFFAESLDLCLWGAFEKVLSACSIW